MVTPRLVEDGPLPDAIAALFDEAVASLEMVTGLTAEPIALAASPRSSTRTGSSLVGIEELTWLGRDVVTEHADELTAAARGALEYAATFTADDYLGGAPPPVSTFVKVLDQLLGPDAIVVSPTMCVEGFYADGRAPGRGRGGTHPGPGLQHAGREHHRASRAEPCRPGASPNGVPFGVQLTGPRFADDLLLAVGAAWEAAHPWPLSAPGFEPFGPGGSRLCLEVATFEHEERYRGRHERDPRQHEDVLHRDAGDQRVGF